MVYLTFLQKIPKYIEKIIKISYFKNYNTYFEVASIYEKLKKSIFSVSDFRLLKIFIKEYFLSYKFCEY